VAMNNDSCRSLRLPIAMADLSRTPARAVS
jgi:hypothetical protein